VVRRTVSVGLLGAGRGDGVRWQRKPPPAKGPLTTAKESRDATVLSGLSRVMATRPTAERFSDEESNRGHGECLGRQERDLRCGQRRSGAPISASSRAKLGQLASRKRQHPAKKVTLLYANGRVRQDKSCFFQNVSSRLLDWPGQTSCRRCVSRVPAASWIWRSGLPAQGRAPFGCRPPIAATGQHIAAPKPYHCQQRVAVAAGCAYCGFWRSVRLLSLACLSRSACAAASGWSGHCSQQRTLRSAALSSSVQRPCLSQA
jgi:hypothetical protein